jgi:hypothetical protein
MKKYYLLFLFSLLLTYTYAQEEELIPGALIGTCLEPDSNLVTIVFDYSKNCPEADPQMALAGAEELGFHSGINDWSTIVAFDAAEATTIQHLGNGIYSLTLNTLDYYGSALADIDNINFILRSANSNDPWEAACRDDKGGGGFGGDEPCNDFQLVIDNMLSCSELEQESSASLLGATTAANSCVDTINGTVTIDFDQSLNCPEADTANVLAGVSALGFQSGANDWAQVVAWDDEGAINAMNNGNNIFSVTVNVQEYYGIPLDSLRNIKMVMNNGIETPDDPWSITGRDERDGGFGGTEPCSDLVFLVSEAPACPVEPEIISSTALLSATDTVQTCVDPNTGRARIAFDNSLNCPEADTAGVLAGQPLLGFHSGINEWAQTVSWDDESAVQAMNNGADIFYTMIDIEAYYGVAFDSVENIRMILNNGVANPGAAWDVTGRDDRDAESFGNIQPCSDLILDFSEAPTCDLSDTPEFNTSKALFSEAAGSCVDRNSGLIRVAFDNSLNCPEADTANILAGASALGFHSGVNNWSSTVSWDDEGAKQAMNDGNGVFSVVIDPATYYGTPMDSISTINMVMNNGIMNPGGAWDVTARDDRNGGFGGNEPCSDLIFHIDEAPVCDLMVVNTVDQKLENSLKVYPNPFSIQVRIEFDNPTNEEFDLTIHDISGRVMRRMSHISGTQLILEKQDLQAGVYFAVLRGKDGRFATTKLLVN